MNQNEIELKAAIEQGLVKAGNKIQVVLADTGLLGNFIIANEYDFAIADDNNSRLTLWNMKISNYIYNLHYRIIFYKNNH